MRPHPAISSRGSLSLFAAAVLGAACQDPSHPPAKLAFIVQPTSIAANAPFFPHLTVAVQDADGNTVTDATHAITIAIGTNAGGGVLAGSTTRSAVSGVATFTDLRINEVGTGYTLTASSPNLTGATSTPFAVVVGPANKLAFLVEPGPATVGVAMAPAVKVAVQDVAGHTVTNETHIITMGISLNAGGATLTGTASVATVNGVATFSNLSIDKIGTGYTLIATSPNLAAAISTSFAVGPGPASRLGFTVQPSPAVTGVVITPAVAVAVQDAGGSIITTATHSITVAIGTNAGSGTLSGTTTVAAVNGVATFSNLSIDNAGTGYTLTATAANLAGGTSAAFSIRNPLVLTTITAGYFHSCGLAVGGAAWCWGSNGGGQLGAAVGTQSPTPVPVSGGLGFAALSAGRTHTCGLTPGGIAYCWGDNSLGAGATLSSPVPVAVAGGLTFARVVAGYGHTCGVTTGGAGYCWGFNGSGELGTGTVSQSSVPVAVAGALVFANIIPGRTFTCGRTPADAAYCWGFNGGGELGDGTTTSRSSPVPVSGGLSFAVVGAGGFHSCGLTTTGAAHCWGDNSFGQLGSGPQGASSTPRPVSGGLTFAMLSVGNRHTCGVTAAGVAYCWGDNSTGMLGTGTTTSSSSPAAVAGGLIFATISAGRFHTCGVTTAGAAYCWGEGGALGNATNQPSLVPTRVF